MALVLIWLLLSIGLVISSQRLGHWMSWEGGSGLAAEFLNLRGWITHKLGRPEKAKALFRAAVAAEPSNQVHYLDLSTVLYDTGESAAALEVLSEGMRQCATIDRLQLQTGVLHLSRGATDEAERLYRRALHSNPSNEAPYVALANLFLTTDRDEQARAILERGLRSLPKAGFLYYVYGTLLLDLVVQDADEVQSASALRVLKGCRGAQSAIC